MRVVVTNCKDPKLEHELITAAKFYTKELLSKQLCKHIYLEIVMKKSLSDLGNCCITYYNDWYKAREFEIELKGVRSHKKMLQTLAHEIVHLKQFAKGELNCNNDRWKGFPIDSEKIPYNDLPWEVEATSLEYILYTMYMEHRNQILKDQ